MVLELKITCTCHQAKIAICGQTPLVALIAPKICTPCIQTLKCLLTFVLSLSRFFSLTGTLRQTKTDDILV